MGPLGPWRGVLGEVGRALEETEGCIIWGWEFERGDRGECWSLGLDAECGGLGGRPGLQEEVERLRFNVVDDRGKRCRHVKWGGFLRW